MTPFTLNETIKAYLYLHSDIKCSDEAKEVITTLEEWRPDWHNLKNPYFERVFPQIFITYAMACQIIGCLDRSIKILEEGIKELSHDDFKYYFLEKATLYDMLVRCYVEKGNDTGAYNAAMESVFNILYSSANVHYNNFEFYGFRSFSEYALSDLRNETLSLCSPLCFNDPVDTPLFQWFHYLKEEVKNDKFKLNYINVMERTYANIRVRCLIRNISVPNKEGRDLGIPVSVQALTEE